MILSDGYLIGKQICSLIWIFQIIDSDSYSMHAIFRKHLKYVLWEDWKLKKNMKGIVYEQSHCEFCNLHQLLLQNEMLNASIHKKDSFDIFILVWIPAG